MRERKPKLTSVVSSSCIGALFITSLMCAGVFGGCTPSATDTPSPNPALGDAPGGTRVFPQRTIAKTQANASWHGQPCLRSDRIPPNRSTVDSGTSVWICDP